MDEKIEEIREMIDGIEGYDYSATTEKIINLIKHLLTQAERQGRVKENNKWIRDYKYLLLYLPPEKDKIEGRIKAHEDRVSKLQAEEEK